MMELTEKKFTQLIAHPDDEVIFSGFLLPYTKKIICCSNNYIDLAGNKHTMGKTSLKEIGQMLNIEIICLDYNRNFYKLDTNHNILYNFSQEIISLIKKEKYLATHNFWGEYGNFDHILIHQLAKIGCKKIYTSNICINAKIGEGHIEWFPTKQFNNGKDLGEYSFDEKIYNQCKMIYESHKCWTWHLPMIKSAKLREIGNYPVKQIIKNE